jgi:hypothetical protein
MISPTKVGGVLVLTNAVVFFFVMHRICLLLQRRYPLLYEELGSPLPIFWNHWYWHWKFIIFLFDRRYRALNDPEITRACDWAYWLMHALIATIGSTIAISLIAVGLGWIDA